MGSLRSRLRARKHDARGAMAVLVALVTCFVLLPLSALAVDIGMQRVARRDVQAVADVVALDMARSLGAGVAPTDALGRARAAYSRGTLGTTPTVRVRTGYIAPTARFVSDQSLGCGGDATAYNAYFQKPASVGKPANAVQVAVSTSVDFAVSPGSGGVCRSALAGSVGAVCYSVGSFAAAVSTGNSALLDPLMRMLAQQSGAFSNSGSVMALGYTGLASSQVSLNALAAGLGVGSVNELATSSVKLHDLYVATLGAMVQPRNATSVTALNTLINTTTYSTARVDLGKLLSIGSGAGSLAAASMNLLDLVGGSLAVINGTNLASLNIGAGLPGVLNANLQVKLIQGAHQFCGSVGDVATTATSASLTEQLKVTGTAQLNPVNATITVPGITGLLGSTTATVALPNNVTTSVSVAPTSTTLTDIRCAQAKGISLNVTNGLATVSIDTYLSNISVNADLLNVTLLGLPIARLNAKITVNTAVKVTATLSPSGVVGFRIDVPSQQYDTAYPTSSGGVGLGVPTLTSPSIQVQSNVTLLGIISAGAQVNLSAGDKDQILRTVVSSVIAPMFDSSRPTSFVSTTVNPILGLLGTQVGGSNVILHGNPPPSCNQPLLKG